MDEFLGDVLSGRIAVVAQLHCKLRGVGNSARNDSDSAARIAVQELINPRPTLFLPVLVLVGMDPPHPTPRTAAFVGMLGGV